MNILFIAILITCVTATWKDLQKAIDEENFDRIEGLCKNGDLHEKGLDYVVKNMSPKFISNFLTIVNSTNNVALITLCEHASSAVVKEVVERTDFPKNALKQLASKFVEGGAPEKAVPLLVKIRNRQILERVVNGVVQQASCQGRETCITRVLDSFRTTILSYPHTQEVTLQNIKALINGHSDVQERDLYEYFASEPRVYAKKLFSLWIGIDKQHSTFQYLLEGADQGDLSVALQDDISKGQHDFKIAINETLGKARLSRGHRTIIPILIAWIAKKVLESMGIGKPTVIADTIGSYITFEYVSTRASASVIQLDTGLNADVCIPAFFKELWSEERYEVIGRIGSRMESGQFFRYASPLITTVDHYKRVYKCLNDNELLPGFLVHGEIGLVRRIIVEYSLQKECHISGIDMTEALVNSLNESDQYERFKNLLSAEEHVHKEPSKSAKVTVTTRYGIFRFFRTISPEQNGISTSLKRFFTLHGQEFSVRYPDTYNVFCTRLVEHLRCNLNKYPKARETMTDLVGQPDLLSSRAIINGLLVYEYIPGREHFLTYAWREAIEEYMFGEYDDYDRQELWEAIVKKFPAKRLDPKVVPSSREELTKAIDGIPTKLEREHDWARKWLVQFEIVPGGMDSFILVDLVNIVLEYATPRITWLYIPILQ